VGVAAAAFYTVETSVWRLAGHLCAWRGGAESCVSKYMWESLPSVYCHSLYRIVFLQPPKACSRTSSAYSRRLSPFPALGSFLSMSGESVTPREGYKLI